MFRKTNKKLISAAVAGVLFSAASASHASLVLVQPEDFNGTGLGAVNTILTIQGKNNAATESGMVAYDGTADVITGDDVKKGASQTQTRTIGSLGITSADSLRIVFNATEPDNMINLTGLTLSFYDSTGMSLYSASLDKAYNNLSPLSGIGNSGFVFALDAAQAAQAQSAVFNLSNFGDTRIGLSATATGFAGGNETFFATHSAATGPGLPPAGNVPEPGSLMLIGLGLAAGALSRKKKA